MSTGPEFPDQPEFSDEPEFPGGQYVPPPPPMLTPPPRSPRRRPGVTGLVAVAVIALAGGAGVTYAATHSGSKLAADSSASTPGAAKPNPSPGPSQPGAQRQGKAGHGRFGGFGGGFGFGGAGGLGALGGGVLHAQATVPKSGGGYQTIDVQRGTVTAVSSTSISVKSADGFTATYTVMPATQVNAQAAGIGSVKSGDTVELTATASGGTATADAIIDQSSIKSGRGSFGFPRGGPNASPPAAPAS